MQTIDRPSAHLETDSEILCEAQLAQIQKDGYCITDVLFDAATLQEIQKEFHRFWQEDIERTKKENDAKKLDFALTKPFLCHLYPDSEICRNFLKSPVFVNLSRQLLGPDVEMLWDQAIIKPPSEGKAFGWHQDAQYAVQGAHAKNTPIEKLTDSKNSITFWVAITRTIVDNGTMWVVPGMHKQGILPHVYSNEQREWQGQYDTSWKVPAVMKAGQVLVFTNCTPHASGANISDEIRMAYQVGYAVTGFSTSPLPTLPILKNNQPV